MRDYQKDRLDADALLVAARTNGDLQVRLFNAVFTLDHRSQLPWAPEIDDATATNLREAAHLALFTRKAEDMQAATDAIAKALRGAP